MSVCFLFIVLLHPATTMPSIALLVLAAIVATSAAPAQQQDDASAITGQGNRILDVRAIEGL